jgi:hypothetical protein
MLYDVVLHIQARLGLAIREWKIHSIGVGAIAGRARLAAAADEAAITITANKCHPEQLFSFCLARPSHPSKMCDIGCIKHTPWTILNMDQISHLHPVLASFSLEKSKFL